MLEIIVRLEREIKRMELLAEELEGKAASLRGAHDATAFFERAKYRRTEIKALTEILAIAENEYYDVFEKHERTWE